MLTATITLTHEQLDFLIAQANVFNKAVKESKYARDHLETTQMNSQLLGKLESAHEYMLFGEDKNC